MSDSHLKILIVEDNAVDRAIWRRHLSRPVDEFEFWEVETGEAGLERCVEFRPDCIFLDFNLPDLTGTEFLRRLQGLHRCAVIVATAYGSEDVAVRSLKTGATDYLVKGVITAEGLRRAIHSAVDKVRLEIEVERRGTELEQRNRDLESKHRDLSAALEGERQARVAAEESESRYRNLTEAIPHVVWTASAPCAFDHVNSRWNKLTGIPVERATGELWMAFVHKDDCPRIAQKWEESARTMRGFEVQFRLRTAGDAWRWQSIRGVPFIEPGNPPVKWYGTLTDIEDRTRAEQMLNQRQKLESIGVLAAGIAHDFNNLLVGVIGNVSLASDILPDCDSAKVLLADAVQSAERVAALTRRLLAYAGKSNFALRRVNLSEQVESTSRLVIPGVSKNIRVTVAVDKGRLDIEADPSQLQQVVMNLVINAAEAIGESNPGTIGLRTSAEEIGETVVGNSGGELAAGRYAVLEVTDNGSGMDEETKARIFDPFFTTRFLGRGLGLASVQGIVRGHKGAIEVHSRPGAGTTFRVLFPLCEETPAINREAGAGEPKTEGVLVVDSDSGVRTFVDQALQRAAVGQVWTATSGEEALAIASEHKNDIWAVLLDLGLSGISGEEILGRLREEGLRCPVIISSANGDVDALRRLGSQTIDCLLIKPYTARDLVKAVIRHRPVLAERGQA